MNITTDLLRSPIARRFCLLFVFCALLPTIFLVFVSFERVTTQLEEQSYQRIKQETKAYGMSLFDRMIRIENTLKSLANMNVGIDPAGKVRLEQFLASTTNQIFTGIGQWQRDGAPVILYGNLAIDELESLQKEFLDTTQSQIMVRPRKNDEETARVFVTVPEYRDQKLQILWIGEVKTDFFWGLGAEPLLPARTELSIYGDQGQRLVGTAFSPGKSINSFKRENVESDLRVFTYSVDEQRFLASSWSLFIRSHFANGTWRIVLAESEKSILANIKDFQTTFLLVTLLALFLTLFLSLIFIRRNLEPLNRLKKGTEMVAKKDFSVALDIRSGDEFEDLGASFNSMTKQLQKQFNALSTIDHITSAILSSLDQTKVIDTSLMMLKDFFKADNAILGQLVGPDFTRVKLHSLEDQGEVTIRYEAVDDQDKKQIFTGQPSYVVNRDDEGTADFFKRILPRQYPFFFSLPLIAGKQLQSVLFLGYANNLHHDEEELKQARQLADQLTIALANARLVNDLEKLLVGTIEALARTVDAKSKWTAGHSERVALLAGRIGKRMGMSQAEVDTLNRGGLLHDIGKIGIPISLLDKPGKLTDEEFAEIKTHPEIGEKILEPIEAYKDITPMIVQHHERYDGKGYPFGLSGEAIDLNARILCVADVYDALVSNRPYRQGWIQQKATTFIAEGAGSHFDPEVVKVFSEIIAEG